MKRLIMGGARGDSAFKRSCALCLSIALISLATSCSIQSAKTASGSGSVSVSVPSVATWISRVASAKSSKAAKAYAFANSIKIEVLSSEGTNVVDPVTSSVSTSVSGGSTAVSVPYVPSGSGYSVKVSVYNSAVSSSSPVVSGTATGVSVTDGGTSSVTVSCLPESSAALSLDSSASFTLASAAETWYSFAATSGTTYSFTLANANSNFAMGLFTGAGKLIASSQSNVTYRASESSTLYIGIAGYGNTDAESGTLTAAVSTASVASVASVSPSAMSSSGATSTPTDLAGIVTALSAIGSEDLVYTDMEDILSSSSSSISTAAQTALDKIESDYASALSSKTLKEYIDLSGEDLSSYLHLTTATGQCSITATTTDGNALSSSYTNFDSATGSFSASTQVDGQSLPSSSAIKYLCSRLNLSGNASIGSYHAASSSSVTLENLDYDYAASIMEALSFVNASGVGGKLIVEAELTDNKTIASLSSTSSLSASSFIPSGTIRVTLYNDSNEQVFTQSWTDIATFIEDIENCGGSLTVTVN